MALTRQEYTKVTYYNCKFFCICLAPYDKKLNITTDPSSLKGPFFEDIEKKNTLMAIHFLDHVLQSSHCRS